MDETADEVTIAAEALAQLERLAVLGRATAGFAHELKNGLMVTHGFAYLARRLAQSSEVDPKLSSHLAEVEAHAARLVVQLRTFLSLAKGSNDEEPRRALRAVVREVGQLARPIAEERGKAMELAVDDAAERPVADPAFRSALLNVALNAIDFARARVRVTLARGEGGWLVTVDDDGAGLDPAQQARLFEPFSSVRAGGTGLGLWQAQEAVAAEGGRISYDEAPSGGARFSLLVPDRP